jgi:hypothetical protein
MAIDVETLSTNDRVKLGQFMDASTKIFQETDDLKAGLKDSAKALAEEFGWKPAHLMKAARIAYKASRQAEKENHDIVDEILEVTGRGGEVI